MTYDRKVYRGSQDAIGAPGDDAATNSTDANTLIGLLKGLYALGSTGNTASSTAALQTSGNATLTAIDGHVDGIETSLTTIAGFVDGLEALSTALNGYVDGLEALAAAATPAGTNLIGRSVADASAATGGIASTSRILSAAATTNATSAKASAGRVYAIQGYNASTSVRYLKIYNKTSAPTVGTDTPIKTLAIPPSVGFAFDWPHGYSLATGIAYALTTGSADADTGAVTAGDILGLNVDYV